MGNNPQSKRKLIQEGFFPIENSEIYYRVIGQGKSIVILHGGPDFNHHYFLPEMDRLSSTFRLIYYDQRGRGRSAKNVQPEAVSIETEIADLETLRAYFHLETFAILGHSWGGLLAMEYAIRHPDRLSRLILMNTAPVSQIDYLLFRQDRLMRSAEDMARLKAIRSTYRYQAGDLETDLEYYRVHFRAALRQPMYLDSLISRLRAHFTEASLRIAREIEDRLMTETWLSGDYNLFPRLTHLHIPTLVMHGEFDFIPVKIAAHIAQSIPGAHLVILKDTGHFAYLETPEEVQQEIVNFFRHISPKLPPLAGNLDLDNHIE
jgi:proline iminopeptidase